MTARDDPAPTPDPGTANVDGGLMRPGGISYIHLPATDVVRAASFYEHVFGWNVSGRDTARPSFDDGTGHVSGAWMADQAVSTTPGILPYIYVDRIDDTIEGITGHGGALVSGPEPTGTLWIATFADSEGNVLGLWHEGPR